MCLIENDWHVRLSAHPLWALCGNRMTSDHSLKGISFTQMLSIGLLCEGTSCDVRQQWHAAVSQPCNTNVASCSCTKEMAHHQRNDGLHCTLGMSMVPWLHTLLVLRLTMITGWKNTTILACVHFCFKRAWKYWNSVSWTRLGDYHLHMSSGLCLCRYTVMHTSTCVHRYCSVTVHTQRKWMWSCGCPLGQNMRQIAHCGDGTTEHWA